MLRILEQSDLPKLLQIEQDVHLVPWTARVFEHCFEAGCIGWVMTNQQEQLDGYIFITLNRPECHILNIGVALNAQHQGKGSVLLQHALQYAQRQGATIAYLEVRPSNVHAIALYKKHDFIKVGERKNYYVLPHASEDALVFAKML